MQRSFALRAQDDGLAGTRVQPGHRIRRCNRQQQIPRCARNDNPEDGAFGDLASSTGAPQNPYRYTGRDYDQETGLYYHRARYYYDLHAKFLQEDPAGFTDGVNSYRYVHNDPVDNTDPYGLTTYKGFPADKEVELRNAANKATQKLREKCRNCAGSDGPKIANIIENATFVYQPKSKYCGETGPISFLGLRHTFGIGSLAFDANRCCLLESTLVHEVVHGMRHWSDKRPDQVEKDCFGCSTPE
jgi:RHS repeat-associated protein